MCLYAWKGGNPQNNNNNQQTFVLRKKLKGKRGWFTDTADRGVPLTSLSCEVVDSDVDATRMFFCRKGAVCSHPLSHSQFWIGFDSRVNIKETDNEGSDQ